MGTLTAYSVELYAVFCRITGYGGTTQITERASDRIVERYITIRFNADTNAALPWRFEPVRDSIKSARDNRRWRFTVPNPMPRGLWWGPPHLM